MKDHRINLRNSKLFVSSWIICSLLDCLRQYFLLTALIFFSSISFIYFGLKAYTFEKIFFKIARILTIVLVEVLPKNAIKA